MNLIDKLTYLITRLISLLVIFLILELVYETIMRYVFNYAVVWSFDISYILYGIIFMLSIPHVEVIDKHVRIEVIYNKLSKKARLTLDLMGYLIFYLPVSVAITYFGWNFFYESYVIRETSGATMWSPPIYPFKFIIPLTGFLLFLQSLSQIVKRIIALFKQSK